MTTRPLRHPLLACLVLGCASFARASTVPTTVTFDASDQTTDGTDYEGEFFDGSAAPYDITIGAFDFTIPTGDVVTGATISGTFGDVNYSSSALADLFVDDGNIQVAGCDLNSDGSYPACFTGTVDGSLVSWSYTFTGAQLSELASDFAAGSIDFTAVQNSFGSLVVGDPTLQIQVAQTPEPSSLFTLAGGLLAIIAWRRRK